MRVEVMMNGQQVPPEDAKISIFDHGFLFGDSVYEVVKTRNGRLFAAALHLKRLHYSANQIGLAVPWPDTQLIHEMTTMANQFSDGDAYVRLVVTRGAGPMSIDPEGCNDPQRIIYAKALSPPDSQSYIEGICIHVSSIRKNPLTTQKGNIKTGNYLDHVLAIRQARQHQCHEALLLNHLDQVAECTTSNIFWVHGGELHTPALQAGILEGVTRQIVIHLATQLGVKTHDGLFPLTELMQADEVFITSTTRDVLPVKRIADRDYPVGPLTKRLMASFAEASNLDLEF